MGSSGEGEEETGGMTAEERDQASAAFLESLMDEGKLDLLETTAVGTGHVYLLGFEVPEGRAVCAHVQTRRGADPDDIDVCVRRTFLSEEEHEAPGEMIAMPVIHLRDEFADRLLAHILRQNMRKGNMGTN